MPEANIRELKAKASDIVRRVREDRTPYLITHRGRPVAALVPLVEGQAPSAGQPPGDVWARLTELGESLNRKWKIRRSSADVLSDMRR